MLFRYFGSRNSFQNISVKNVENERLTFILKKKHNKWISAVKQKNFKALLQGKFKPDNQPQVISL